MNQQDQKSPESPAEEARSLLAYELKWLSALLASPGHDGKQRRAAITKARKLQRQILKLFGAEAQVAIDAMDVLNMMVAALRCFEFPKNQIDDLREQMEEVVDQIATASLEVETLEPNQEAKNEKQPKVDDRMRAATPKQKKSKRRGRRKADDETVEREAEITEAWAKAKRSGVYKPDFARDKKISLKDFNNLLARVSRRNSRANK